MSVNSVNYSRHFRDFKTIYQDLYTIFLAIFWTSFSYNTFDYLLDY